MGGGGGSLLNHHQYMVSSQLLWSTMARPFLSGTGLVKPLYGLAPHAFQKSGECESWTPPTGVSGGCQICIKGQRLPGELKHLRKHQRINEMDEDERFKTT